MLWRGSRLGLLIVVTVGVVAWVAVATRPGIDAEARLTGSMLTYTAELDVDLREPTDVRCVIEAFGPDHRLALAREVHVLEDAHGRVIFGGRLELTRVGERAATRVPDLNTAALNLRAQLRLACHAVISARPS